MSRAFELPKNDATFNRGRILMCIEGPEAFIRFVASELAKDFDDSQCEEEGKNAGEVALFFGVDRADKPFFMQRWKEIKQQYVKPESLAAADALQSAKAALKRATSKFGTEVPSPEHQKYVSKRMSMLRGGVTRAFRAMFVAKHIEAEIASFFYDDKHNRPRKVSLPKTTYFDTLGAPVSRDVAAAAAVEHWALITKVSRVHCELDGLSYTYAKSMISFFGCVEIYASYMGVGDTGEIRLPVVMRAVAGLSELPVNVVPSVVNRALELAIAFEASFYAWMSCNNAMFHHDVITIATVSVGSPSQYATRLNVAISTLLTMQGELLSSRHVVSPAAQPPLVISVCSPE